MSASGGISTDDVPSDHGCEQALVAMDGTVFCVPPGRRAAGTEAYLTSEGSIGCRPITTVIQ
jgi:hypothetical protein